MSERCHDEMTEKIADTELLNNTPASRPEHDNLAKNNGIESFMGMIASKVSKLRSSLPDAGKSEPSQSKSNTDKNSGGNNPGEGNGEPKSEKLVIQEGYILDEHFYDNAYIVHAGYSNKGIESIDMPGNVKLAPPTKYYRALYDEEEREKERVLKLNESKK